MEERAIFDGIRRSGTGLAAGPRTGEGPAVLKQIPLSLIVSTCNPRRAVRARNSVNESAPSGNSETPDTDADLEGLARSLGTEQDSRLVEPPVVEELPDGHYRLCAGERRVEAARLAKWTSILCLIYPPMDPIRAHTLGLVENMHRLPMHPLEEISALCISRLLANADTRGVGGEARQLLEDARQQRASSYSIIQGLERILESSGWSSARPDVTWRAHLDDLGISMAPWERKRKLRLLNIEPHLQEQLWNLDITEAALRSLGTLEPGDQERVVEALIANPALARKVRRIARARREGFYPSIEDALSEVQGVTSQVMAASVGPIRAAIRGDLSTPAQPVDQRGGEHAPLPAAAEPAPVQLQHQVPSEVQDAVLQLLECVDRFSSAMNTLRPYGGGTTLPEPWGTWSREALDLIKRASMDSLS
jgi:ParB-like chromosome segregation protein Spo0J